MGADRKLWWRTLLVACVAVLAPVVTVAHAAPTATPVGWAPGAFVPLRTYRLLDTATGNGAPKRPVAALSTLPLQVGGRGSVPGANVGAVVLNVAAVGVTGAGSVVVYPHGTRRPNTVHVRYATITPVANLVTVPVGAGGMIDLYNLARSTANLVVDVVGYYVAGAPSVVGTFQPVAAARVLDTHTGRGAPGGAAGPLPALNGAQVFVTGRPPIPADGVGTVVLNVTVSAPTASGSLTIFPNETAQPKTMSVSFGVGQMVSTQVTVRLGTYEAISVVNNSLGSVHVTADVVGWFVSQYGRTDVLVAPINGATVGIDPARVFQSAAATPVPANGATTVKVLGRLGIPSTGVSAVLVSLTEVKSTAPGSLVVHASGTPVPSTASLYFPAGRRVTNSAIVPVGLDGSIRVVNRSKGSTQVMVVVQAYVRHGTVAVNPVSTGGFAPQLGPAMLNSLSCPTASFCATVDQFGNALTYDGVAWSARRHVIGGAAALSCSGPTFCMVVGSGEYAVFNGTAWSSSLGGVPFTPSFVDVSCSSATRCVAVVAAGQINTSAISSWNGAAWSTPRAAPHLVSSLDCVTDSWCMAVGGGRASVLAGTTWSAPTELVSLGNARMTVSCGAVDACTVITPTSQLAVLDDAGWHDGLSFSAQPLRDVSCVDQHACLLVTAAAVIQIDGITQVGAFPAPRPNGTDVACAAASHCVSTFVDGSVATLDAGVWSDPVPVDPAGGVTGVSCLSATDCVAVTDGGTVTRFDGQRWSSPAALPKPAGSVSGYSDVACRSAAFCAAVGPGGAVATFDGSAWALDAAAPTDSFTSVACPGIGFCVAASGFAAFVGDHGTWTRYGFPTFVGSSFVDCTTATRCVLVGGATWSTFDGTTWTPPSDLGFNATAIDCVSDNWCVAVGESAGVGRASVIDGTAWSTAVSGIAATSVSCTSTTWCAAVDDSGRLATFNGAMWSSPQTVGAFGTRYRVECVAVAKCVVTGA